MIYSHTISSLPFQPNTLQWPGCGTTLIALNTLVNKARAVRGSTSAWTATRWNSELSTCWFGAHQNKQLLTFPQRIWCGEKVPSEKKIRSPKWCHYLVYLGSPAKKSNFLCRSYVTSTINSKKGCVLSCFLRFANHCSHLFLNKVDLVGGFNPPEKY